MPNQKSEIDRHTDKLFGNLCINGPWRHTNEERNFDLRKRVYEIIFYISVSCHNH